jgi:hypothetical protein
MRYKRLTINDLNDEGCINVLCEFVRVVGEEYEQCLDTARKYPSDMTSREHQRYLERFIRSNYFCKLTGLDGDEVIKLMKERYYTRVNAGRVRMFQSV